MKDFSYYFAQLRKIEDHREQKAEKEIRKLYKELLKETKHFIAHEYEQLADDGKLTYELLRAKGQDTRFLAEVEQRLNDLSPKVSQEIRQLVEEMYELGYESMYDAMRFLEGEELEQFFGNGGKPTADAVRAMIDNPIAGLTLNDTLEKNRKNIIWDIKREIGIGLTVGDRYETMAKRIAKSLDGDYKKAIRIVRTEAGRVRERAHLDSALEINDALKDSDLNKKLVKTWKTMKDGSVRPNGQKKATYDHVKMEGMTIGADEDFVMPDGTKMKAPKQSGVAGHDINCRCFAKYDLISTVKQIVSIDDAEIQAMQVTAEVKERLYKPNSRYIADINGKLDAFEEQLIEFTAGETYGAANASKAIIDGDVEHIKKLLEDKWGKKDVEFAKTLLDLIEDAPVYEGTLYRVEDAGANKELKGKIGSKFTLGTRSFTRNEEWLESAVEELGLDEAVIYQLKNAKAINMKPYSPYFQEQAESVTAGEFKIIGIKETEINGVPTKVYEVEQVGIKQKKKAGKK